jgi:hypothetical protein
MERESGTDEGRETTGGIGPPGSVSRCSRARRRQD